MVLIIYKLKDQNLKLKIGPFSFPLPSPTHIPQIFLDLNIFNYIESVFSCVATNKEFLIEMSFVQARSQYKLVL